MNRITIKQLETLAANIGTDLKCPVEISSPPFRLVVDGKPVGPMNPTPNELHIWMTAFKAGVNAVRELERRDHESAVAEGVRLGQIARQNGWTVLDLLEVFGLTFDQIEGHKDSVEALIQQTIERDGDDPDWIESIVNEPCKQTPPTKE